MHSVVNMFSFQVYCLGKEGWQAGLAISLLTLWGMPGERGENDPGKSSCKHANERPSGKSWDDFY